MPFVFLQHAYVFERLTEAFQVRSRFQTEMASYLNSGYDVMNYFAKFEKFSPHSIIVPSFMTVGSQMTELDLEASLPPPPPPPYKLGNQNTPYKLGLRLIHMYQAAESKAKVVC